MAKKPPGFDDRLYVTVSVTSASVAKAVMPTAVPMAAFSATVLPDASASETAEMAVSLTSLTSMVKLCVLVEPSVDVAVTSMVWLVAVSASRLPATVTMPVFASMANRPPALSVRLYVTVSVTSGSVASAVMPTTAPTLASSSTAFAAALLSETGPTLLSDVSSVRLMVKVSDEVEPSVDVAVTSTVCEVAVS